MSDVREHLALCFRLQGGACTHMGSAFYGELCELLARDAEAGELDDLHLREEQRQEVRDHLLERQEQPPRADLEEPRQGAPVVGDPQRHPAGGERVDHPHALGVVHGHRLLDQAWLAGGRRRERQLEM